MHKAIAYIQSSSPDPVDKPKVEAYCDAKGLRVVEWLIDHGETAALPFDQRPAGSWYLRLSKRHRTRDLVAPNIYHLFRDVVDAGNQIKRWYRRGKRLHLLDLVGEPYVMDGPNSRAFAMAFVALGRMQSVNLREQTAMSLAKRKVLGWVHSQTPYGFDRKGDLLIANPDEQAVIARMGQMRKERLSYPAIAETLNREGVRTKKGGSWHGGTVRNIIMRPKPLRLRSPDEAPASWEPRSIIYR